MDQLLVDPASGQKADGFVWGVPRDVSTFALYLNLDLIDKAGVDDPRQLAADGKWTWDAFQETAKAISDLGGGVKGFGAGGWWANWGYWVNSAGGSFFNEDRTACNLDSDESVNGIEYYQKLYARRTTASSSVRTRSRSTRAASSACSSTVAGPPPAPARSRTSTGTSHRCRPGLLPVGTGSSGAPT